MVITAIHGEYILHRFAKTKLIVFCSLIPMLGHFIIFIIPDCSKEESMLVEFFLILGLSFFGMGLGSYYSISFPAVGYTVP